MFCKNCGSQMPEGTKFCSNCGAVSASEPAQSQQVNSSTTVSDSTNVNNQQSNDKTSSFSRVPNGTGEFAWAAPTKGAANGDKVADLEHTPKQ